MYEKNIGSVIETPSAIGALSGRKRRSFLSCRAIAAAKYASYLLGVVLLLLLFTLILKTVILSPVANATATLKTAASFMVPDEAPMTVTPAIYPKTAVYYHGVRLGEYEGEVQSVGDVLESFNVVLGENDVSNYDLDEPVFFGMTVNVDEVTYKEQIVNKSIPYDIVEIESHNVPRGERVVQTKGVMGASQEVVKTKYVNGEPTEDSTSFDRYVEPVNEEVLIGVGGTFTAPDGKEYDYSYYLDVTATAYTHTGNLTKMGTEARVGVIAVDRKNIKLGSKVYVTGNYGDYGVCSAEDIGGGIRGLRIDIFLDTEEECVKFGRRKMRVYVLE